MRLASVLTPLDDHHLKLAAQCGVEEITVRYPGENREDLLRTKAQIERFGMNLGIIEGYLPIEKLKLGRDDEGSDMAAMKLLLQHMSEAEERAQIAAASSIIRDLSGGQWPFGWYTGRDSPNTMRLVLEHGGFEYDSDYYGDDLPFYLPVEMSDGSVQRQLIVPYTLDANDMKFSSPAGFANGQDFAQYLIDTFDVLYAEGEECPKMMSVGMHCRLLGKPARMAGLMKFLDHVEKHDRVWVARRIDIARHWRAVHPYSGEVR